MFGVMMLLIPATSIANAQEYEDRYGKASNVYYEDERYYQEGEYTDKDQYYEDEYIYEEYYYPLKDKKQESPLLLVKKDVLYCVFIANGTALGCGFDTFPGPEDTDTYVQDCTATEGLEGEVCSIINEELFKIIVTDDIEFTGSEEGIKLNFNGERYAVTEDINSGEILQNPNFNSECQEAGFDGGFEIPDIPGLSNSVKMCVLFEGNCSGIVEDIELKECTIKNYVINLPN